MVTMPMMVRCLPHRSGFEMRRRESSADVGEEKWSQGQTRQLEVCHYCRRVRPAILPILKLILKFFGRSHRPLSGEFWDEMYDADEDEDSLITITTI